MIEDRINGHFKTLYTLLVVIRLFVMVAVPHVRVIYWLGELK